MEDHLVSILRHFILYWTVALVPVSDVNKGIGREMQVGVLVSFYMADYSKKLST